MKERDFVRAYLLGRHDVLRMTGERLLDIEYYQIEHDPYEIEVARAQYHEHKDKLDDVLLAVSQYNRYGKKRL